MPLYAHTLSDGLSITLNIKRTNRKNLILRPVDAQTVSLNIPPSLSLNRLYRWLHEHETLLHQTLSRTPSPLHTAADSKPDWIWYQGIQTALVETAQPGIEWRPSEIRLPAQSWPQQHAQLQHFLYEQAAEYLFPRLKHYADVMKSHPAAMALSRAKTFWGVCRMSSGIRLNWRLIGAPEFVADYVCIHELSHLVHPNHSALFWQRVNQYTPHTTTAKAWLKQHGHELFLLG